jgi:putative endopeptidase
MRIVGWGGLVLVMLISSAMGQTAASAKSEELPTLNHFDASVVDRNLDPCVDFYKFVCSKWQAANPIPADKAAWGTDTSLVLWNWTVLRNRMEEAAKAGPGRTAVQQKIGDYWSACMDEAGIEKSGMALLEPELKRIRGMKDKSEIAGVLAEIHMKTPYLWADSETVAPMFGFSPIIDRDNAKLVVAGVDQGGFAMSGRDFYLSDDAHPAEVRGKYLEHVQKIFTLAGANEAKAKADAVTVLRMETAMAKAAMDEVSRRDPHKTNNVMDLQQMQALTPSFRWKDYLSAVNSPTPHHYIVGAPDFSRALETLLQSESLDSWKAYLSYWVVDRNARYMGKAFQEASFDFWGRTMYGVQVMFPRWQRCVFWADRDLGEALGQAYVTRAFPPESKARAKKMINGIEAAMSQDIQQADWMSPATKQQAQIKLQAVLNNIGYPDQWRDYSSVTIGRDSFLANVQAAAVFEYKRQLDKIGKPVDRTDWKMTPPTVDAYEIAETNTIGFPAGILQPPLFDANADGAVNYGAIGQIMGHEVTHGFDDQGRKFDAQGNLRDWWTEQDAKAYQQRGKCISDEYTQEVAELGVKTNGLFTQGEDTADNGGMRLAYMALEQSLREQGKSLDDKGTDGLTARQRFFVAHGYSRCINIRPEVVRNSITINPHSLNQFRVNNVVSNMPEFWQAFGCKAGQPMVRANACRVW